MTITLRNWQRQALERYPSVQYKGYVEVATGAGKTVFALEAAKLLQNDEQKLKILILVPSLTLLDQWYVILQEHFGSSISDDFNGMNDIVICTYSKALRRNEAILRFAEGWSLIILDEVHTLGAPMNRTIPVHLFRFRLGLSATPERRFDESFTSFITEIIGPLFYRYPLRDAIADDALAPYTSTNILVPLTSLEQAAVIKLSRSIALAMSLNDEERVKSCSLARAKVIRRAVARVPISVRLAIEVAPQKTLIFFEDIDMARKCNETCTRKGLDTALYHSQMTKSARRQALTNFQFGLTTALIACRALDEGFDEPSASVAIIGAGSSSSRQRVQRIGRVLRKAPGKAEAMVFSLYASKMEQQLLETDKAAIWKKVNFNA